LFDLTPLTATTVNDKVRMTTAEARAASPLFWPASPGRMVDAWVGGTESAEYLRQSRALADTWGAAGVATRYVEVPDANHFTVIAPLADPASALVARLAELAAHGAI
jgi:arylformamidase